MIFLELFWTFFKIGFILKWGYICTVFKKQVSNGKSPMLMSIDKDSISPATYAGNQNSWGGDAGLIPMSTIGKIDTTKNNQCIISANEIDIKTSNGTKKMATEKVIPLLYVLNKEDLSRWFFRIPQDLQLQFFDPFQP